MNLLRILESKYLEYEWSLKGEGYEHFNWSENNSIPKPTETELNDIWSQEEFQNQLSLTEVQEKRKNDIRESWPIEAQFEALTENAMGRPEKLNELINFINQVKEKYPKD